MKLVHTLAWLAFNWVDFVQLCRFVIIVSFGYIHKHLKDKTLSLTGGVHIDIFNALPPGLASI